MLAMPSLAVAAVTYSDVKPILRERCEGCHQAGEIGPMALGTYQQARPWAKAIRQAVMERTMPPWHADEETSRRIRNSRALAKHEVDAIVKWVDDGALEGAAVEATAGVARPSGWRLGKPDLVIRVPGYKVPAG